MKVWKKLSAVALALMMVLALCVMASAEETDPPATSTSATLDAGVAKGTDNAAIANTLTIPKAITVKGTPAQVYSPTITYTYTIAPVAAASLTSNGTRYTVTDTNNGIGTVKEGPTDGVNLTADSTAVFTSALKTLTDGQVIVSDTITVTVDPTKFNNETYGPGVYRYAITGDNSTVMSNAGVTSKGSDNRFLDVYIKNPGANEGSGLVVYGYVLLTENASVGSGTTKSSGFTTDEYQTIDVQLKKVITGDAANKTHQFPFTITVINNGLSYLYEKGDTTLKTDGSTTALQTALANEEVFHIKGLNPKATVTYVETNDTSDTYKVTVTDGATTPATLVEQTNVAANGTLTTTALAVSNYTDSTSTPTASANAAVTFTNALDAISPTGVALRYAPYLAMLGAGVVALPLSRRKKEEEL